MRSVIKKVLSEWVFYRRGDRKVLLRPAGWVAVSVLALLLLSLPAFGLYNLYRAFGIRGVSSGALPTPTPIPESPALDVLPSGEIVQVLTDPGEHRLMLEALLRVLEWYAGSISVLPNINDIPHLFADIPQGVEDPAFAPCQGWCLNKSQAEAWARAAISGRGFLVETTALRDGWEVLSVRVFPSGVAVLEARWTPRGQSRVLNQKTGEVRVVSDPSVYRYVAGLVRDGGLWKVAQIKRYREENP